MKYRQPKFEDLEQRTMFAATPLLSAALQGGPAAVGNGGSNTVVVSPAVTKSTIQDSMTAAKDAIDAAFAAADLSLVLGICNKTPSTAVPKMSGPVPLTARGAAIPSQDDILNATRCQTQVSFSSSMQYLMLQERMQRENRECALIGSIMATKHDTITNAIANIR